MQFQFLKSRKITTLPRANGRAFHNFGAATENALSPFVLRLDLGLRLAEVVLCWFLQSGFCDKNKISRLKNFAMPNAN